MKIDKGNISLNVAQMSDGEKCILALLGDLARRLALANPNKGNPLLGQGIVLIDEVELHMHPSWQRKILSVLKETFPNIQFIITTHSPIILSEVDENFNLFFMKNDNGKISVEKIKQLSGYDANAVLEQFMGTKSINARTESLIHSIYVDIEKKNYDSAIAHINKIIGNDKRKSSGCYHVPNGVKKEELRKEQKGLCAYCCGRITQETSHNEHIEPRHPGQYESKRSLDYYNINCLM